jgi:hypothetical protein
MYKNHLNYYILSQVLSGKPDNHVSNRTRSKADYVDQHICSRTWFKIQNLNLNNLSVKNLFNSLHDAISFQGRGKYQKQDLRLRVLECKVYHNILLNTKSHVDFDH